MKGKLISLKYLVECQYELGECHYKHPDNKYSCIHCRFAKMISKTPPEIINQNEHN